MHTCKRNFLIIALLLIAINSYAQEPKRQTETRLKPEELRQLVMAAAVSNVSKSGNPDRKIDVSFIREKVDETLKAYPINNAALSADQKTALIAELTDKVIAALAR